MNGRIGVAKRIHIIKEAVPGNGYVWASSYCGWAGIFAESDEDPTCFSCRMALKRAQKEEPKKETKS